MAKDGQDPYEENSKLLKNNKAPKSVKIVFMTVRFNHKSLPPKLTCKFNAAPRKKGFHFFMGLAKSVLKIHSKM